MPQKQERKEGFGILKTVVFVVALLIIGATILSRYTGANKVNRGDGVQDDPCTGTQECAEGHVCYQYATNPFGCKMRCKEDDECGSGYTCKSVVRFGKKKVKPLKVCVANSELE